MKRQRQTKILEIIEQNCVQTQEGLLDLLTQAGYSVTQATISRDIRELNLVKATGPNGEYRYMAGKVDSPTPKFQIALTDSITKVDAAGNLIVIKTFSGMAQAVATCIDSLNTSDIIGCVAGDDAILVVVKTEAAAHTFCDRIKDMIKTL